MLPQTNLTPIATDPWYLPRQEPHRPDIDAEVTVEMRPSKLYVCARCGQ